MVLESTVVCIDNSDFMRNGDFVPSRIEAQQDAVDFICRTKTRSNPENNISLLTLANVQVLVTLTTDAAKVLAKLHQIKPGGAISFVTGIRIAHLVLKHRQGRNHKMKIVVFVGSPVENTEDELVRLAKRLKKEKVNVDLVNFGEDTINTVKLTTFINTLNGGSDSGTPSSQLLTVSAGSPGSAILSEALASSTLFGEDSTMGGAGYGASGGFGGADASEDPDLLMAIRMSLEEQRMRQNQDDGGITDEASAAPGIAETPLGPEELNLRNALQSPPEDLDNIMDSAMSDPSAMTEDEQIAWAIRESMSAAEENPESSAMETEENIEESLRDKDLLKDAVAGLDGVDPEDEAIKEAINSLAENKKDDEKKKEDS